MKINKSNVFGMVITAMLLILNASCREANVKTEDMASTTDVVQQINDDYPFDENTIFSPIYNRQNLGSWTLQGNGFWEVEEEAFVGRQDPSEVNDSWLFSHDEYDDFVLELEFNVPENSNSGVAIRMPLDSIGDPDIHGYEVQISDLPERKLTGSLLHHVDSSGDNNFAPNKWNHMAVICEGDHITVYLNHNKILDEHVEGSKRGRVGFQVPKEPEFANQVVKFRNIKVKDLNPIDSYIPSDYQGKPFVNVFHKMGPQIIPGKVECAYFDMGGEGISYHDLEAENRGSGGLNMAPRHQRPHATPYQWEFRKNEGVDVSYTKDFADFNHTDNYYVPAVNQFYVGWTEDNEWMNYTVNVQVAGTYKITALYGHMDSVIKFDIDGKPAGTYKLPLNTGDYHHWSNEEIGTIKFNEVGLHLLTFHHDAGNNYAYFEFTLID